MKSFQQDTSQEVYRVLFDSLLSMDTTALKELFPEGPNILPSGTKKAWGKYSSFTYSDQAIEAIFGSVKLPQNDVAIEQLNKAARAYFAMEAILKPSLTLDEKNKLILSKAINIILKYLENFDPRWGIPHDEGLFGRLKHDLRLFHDRLPERSQRHNRRCRPEESGRYLFIKRLADIYHGITRKVARKPGKNPYDEKGEKTVKYDGPFFRFVEACINPVEPIDNIALGKAINKAL